MISNLEFFVGRNGLDVVCHGIDGTYHVISEDDVDIIHDMYHRIKSDYPDAFNALNKTYGKSPNFQFLCVRRFIRCNFSVLDDKFDIKGDGSMRLENVYCPLRGECQHDGIICHPKFCNTLSKRELEIVKLICSGMTDAEIGNTLFLSELTAQNHRKNILRKLNLHSKAEIVAWAHQNNCNQ